jgi:hypothetical protein
MSTYDYVTAEMIADEDARNAARIDIREDFAGRHRALFAYIGGRDHTFGGDRQGGTQIAVAMEFTRHNYLTDKEEAFWMIGSGVSAEVLAFPTPEHTVEARGEQTARQWLTFLAALYLRSAANK